MTGISSPWTLLIGVNVVLLVIFSYAIMAPPSPAKTMLLPGKTTHGHYQIEMQCSACHTEGGGVDQDACLKCHAQELKIARDTHPAKKFNDPTNADRLQILDAQNCLTCHREHVEEQTLQMGLTMPSDYCFHCHQDTLVTRPSHKDFKFDSCATAGCHNYHDNRALYENFLVNHANEPANLDRAITLTLPSHHSIADPSKSKISPDHPADQKVSTDILDDWGTTAHAAAGVNCSGCHVTGDGSAIDAATQGHLWSDAVSHDACAECHDQQVEGFLSGRHGMRLAQNLPAMTPGDARLAMHQGASHMQLNCTACHDDHRFDTRYAAVDACLVCHNDEHSTAYKQSSHFALWKNERDGDLPDGSGVSCATCHMPRIEDDDGDVSVQHNQNNNLRPNEKMIREVCLNCHGLSFAIDSLADRSLIKTCYGDPPSSHVESVDLATAWIERKSRDRKRRAGGNQTSDKSSTRTP